MISSTACDLENGFTRYAAPVIGIVATLDLSAAGTIAILAFFRRVFGWRMDAKAFKNGFDLTHHGERAFTP